MIFGMPEASCFAIATILGMLFFVALFVLTWAKGFAPEEDPPNGYD